MLRNGSGADTTLVVGVALDNGDAYFPVGVSVRRTTRAGEEKFSYSPVPPVRVSGRLNPWLVPLPTGAIYSFSIPTTHFWNLQSGYLDQLERTVQIVLGSRVRHTTGLAPSHVWTGELASAAIKLPVDCRIGM